MLIFERTVYLISILVAREIIISEIMTKVCKTAIPV
jgi:hypothetical protein